MNKFTKLKIISYIGYLLWLILLFILTEMDTISTLALVGLIASIFTHCYYIHKSLITNESESVIEQFKLEKPKGRFD